MHLRQIFLWSMVASLGLDAVLGIAALLLPVSGPVGETLGSAALFAGFSLLALLCAIVLERQRLEPLMWAGIGCAGAALVPWLLLTWFDRVWNSGAEEAIARMGGTFTVAPIIIAQCGLISLLRLQDRWVRWVRLGTYVASALLGAYVLVLIWWWRPLERLIDDDNLMRALGVMSILAMCGTVITPILWKVQAVRRATTTESIPVNVQVRLTCPRCNCEQALSTGRGACGSCGLHIALSVEEPRCACGYLLHGLPGDRCPECGRVPGAEREPAPVRRPARARAALVAGVLPVLLLLVFVGAYWSMFGGAWAPPAPPADPGANYPPAYHRTNELNNLVLSYGQVHAAGPGHAIELTVNSYPLPPGRFCDVGTRTSTAGVPVGDGTLDDFSKASRTDQLITIGSVLRAMPDRVSAHRLGDFVFTYHGAALRTNDPQLWTVVMLPDPDANGPPSPADPVWIGTAGYNVFETTIEELPGLLREQDLHRATLGLPPVADLTEVTHARPLIAAAP